MDLHASQAAHERRSLRRVKEGGAGALRPVRDRLGDQAVRELVASFQSGVPLATRYGISLSSVKRLLRGSLLKVE
jgi:hypothetical protein